MQRIATDHLAALPHARTTLEKAQLQAALGDSLHARNPELFIDRFGDPRWMTDLSLPVGFRSSVVCAEGALLLVKCLTSPNLRALVVTPAQLHAVPDLTLRQSWETITGGDRAPFPLTWIEVGGDLLVDVQALGGTTWESTGTDTKLHRLLGFMLNDFADGSALVMQAVMQEVEAVTPGVRRFGADLNPGVKLVIPRTPTAFDGARLDGATVVLRGVADDHEELLHGGEDAPFFIEAARSFQHPDGEGGATMDRENGMLVVLTEGWLPYVAGLLMLLGSTNVDAGRDPEQMSREQRRAVKRGAVEPDFILVRQRRTRRADGGEPTGRHLTKRHEVRGHFKHWGEGTRAYELSDPAKRRHSSDRGHHVRYWTPPHVRGPQDAPLIIRPRKLSGTVNNRKDAAA